jgi:CheY-like chemotaxis protein
VVDDKPLVRAVAVDALEDAGFDVLEAAIAEYALAVPEGARGHLRPSH